MTKSTKKADVQKKTEDKGKFLQFWNEDGAKVTHTYLIEATEEIDGKMYAKITIEGRFSKAKDTLGALITFGKKATMYVGASTKKLGRVFFGEPKKIEENASSVEQSIL